MGLGRVKDRPRQWRMPALGQSRLTWTWVGGCLRVPVFRLKRKPKRRPPPCGSNSWLLLTPLQRVFSFFVGPILKIRPVSTKKSKSKDLPSPANMEASMTPLEDLVHLGSMYRRQLGASMFSLRECTRMTRASMPWLRQRAFPHLKTQMPAKGKHKSASFWLSFKGNHWATKKSRKDDLLVTHTVDGRNPAPPKKPGIGDSPVHANQHGLFIGFSWFQSGAKWNSQPSTWQNRSRLPGIRFDQAMPCHAGPPFESLAQNPVRVDPKPCFKN